MKLAETLIVPAYESQLCQKWNSLHQNKIFRKWMYYNVQVSLRIATQRFRQSVLF